MSTTDMAMNYMADMANRIKNNHVRLQFFSRSISIAGGSNSSPKTTNVTISSVLSSGEYLVGVIGCLNAYSLPYVNTSNGTHTWVSAIHDNYFTLSNTAGAWSNYTGYFALLIHTP